MPGRSSDATAAAAGRVVYQPFLGPENNDDLGDLRVDFGFGIGCFSFAINSRKFGMKFPKTFLNHLILTAGPFCQNWNGAERLHEGASDVQQMAAPPFGPQRVFSNLSYLATASQ